MFFAANRYFFWKFAQKGRSMGFDENHIFFKFLNEQRWSLDVIYLVTAVIACGILLAHGLYLSNRVAGPLHRLNQYLRNMLDGRENAPLSFREKDYFQELTQSVNEAAEAANFLKDAKSKKSG